MSVFASKKTRQILPVVPVAQPVPQHAAMVIKGPGPAAAKGKMMALPSVYLEYTE